MTACLYTTAFNERESAIHNLGFADEGTYATEDEYRRSRGIP